MSKYLHLRRPAKAPGQMFKIERTAFYDDWWARFGNADLRKAVEHFGIDTLRRSSCLDGFHNWLTEINFRGRRCVEIGTCKGMTALVLARHFQEVVTLDIIPDEEKRAIAEYCGIRNIRYLDISDNDEKAAIIKGLDFDAAYCDGNHERDAETDFSLVRKCGRVLFHEYWPLQPPIWELVNRLRECGTIQTHGTLALWTHRPPTN